MALPARTVRLPRGLFGPDAVDVGYEPWRVLRESALRVGPDGRAAIVTHRGVLVRLAAGQHLGRQTTRNPSCLDRPPLRAAVNGFVWGYGMAPAIRKSGWLAVADLELDVALVQLACGPAGADFDRRRPRACGGHCDGRSLSGLRAAAGSATVAAREVYLRYAPGSTAFRYLVRGDRVRLLVRTADAAWIGVEVRTARWASSGARGWVLASAISR